MDLKLVLISDTHGKHDQLGVLPEGDVLVHAGDWSMMGTRQAALEFIEWFAAQPHPYKALIAGNHDWIAEKQPHTFLGMIPLSIRYLNDSGCEIEGVRFWGSPVQPWFHDWAFNRARGEDIKRHWDMIPNDTDVLVTHGPAMYHGGVTEEGDEVGCEDLLLAIKRIRPQVHVCGHIHEGYGQWELQHADGRSTTLVNASVVNRRYQVANAPVCVTVHGRHAKDE